MTGFAAFDDDRLDANLAAILGLSDQTVEESAVATDARALSRMRASRRASVTTVAALGIALCGAVALLVAHDGTGTDVPKAREGRHVIDLSGTATIPRAPAPTVAPTDAAAIAPGTRPRRRPLRQPARVAAGSGAPIVAAAPSPAATGAAPAAVATVAPARSVAAANAAIIAAIDAPRAPSATPAPPPAPADEATATRHDRRDSVDAIRSLRRQW